MADRAQLNVRIDEEVEAAIEELRRMQSPIPTKTQVIRQAVLETLARAKTGRERKRA